MDASDLENAVTSIGTDHLPESLGQDRRALVEIFARQVCDGQDRSSDPYFTNDRGHNVGRDVLVAASLAARQLSDLPEEPADQVVARLIGRLKVAKAGFKDLHFDPDGYGAATFGEVERGLQAFAARLAQERSSEASWRTKIFSWVKGFA